MNTTYLRNFDSSRLWVILATVCAEVHINLTTVVYPVLLSIEQHNLSSCMLVQ